MNKTTRAWIEAMRLHTLPVSVAGVLAGAGCAAYFNSFHTLPFVICLLFAIGAQIASNFANEYFDFKNGLDRKGRAGFRRGVTEGDLSPKAMRNATFGLLAVTCALGCTLIYWGGWWLIGIGVAVAIFAIAYSAGPYPLSHHGLGEIAVIIFFGLVPVVMTTYVQAPGPETLPLTLPVGAALGIMGANVLIVNNYRDVEDDRAAGKRTLAVRWGLKAMRRLYFINGLIAIILLAGVIYGNLRIFWLLGPLVYYNFHYILTRRLRTATGPELNAMLGKTAMEMLLLSIWMTVALCVR